MAKTVFAVSDQLTDEQKSDVLDLLKAADKEFVPPLSSRSSTTQKDLNYESDTGCMLYYEQMIQQSFILVMEDEKVVGFLSYRKDHNLELDDEKICCDYVSTIIVSPLFRNRGLTQKMYEALFAYRKGKAVATRTWSQNASHIHVLGKLGFELVKRIVNDRGEGIDTVYYLKG